MDTTLQDPLRIDYPSPDPARPYVYPGTVTLINHFGIADMEVLQRVVDTVADLRGEQLRAAPPAGEHDLAHLCAIHRALFRDIFAWAGQVRIVDTEKNGQNFILAADIPGSFRAIHQELKAGNFLRGLDAEEFASRLARFWYAVYAVHVFRDGNSRSMRHYFATLAAAAGYRLDYSLLERRALREACRHNYFNQDIAPLRGHLRRILVPC